jgi:iron complex outermembrane receptor protein
MIILDTILNSISARFFLLCLIFLFQQQISAQCDFKLSGTIKEEHTDESLEYATVYLVSKKISVVTDSSGTFRFDNLCAGVYEIQYTHPGCKTERISVVVNADTKINLELHHHEIDLNEVVVSQHKRESTPTQQVETLKEQALFESRGLPFAEALRTLTGVNSLRTGSTISKPIIHGMTGNRIVIVNNGIKLEGQQWGQDHAPEIDAYLAKKITVIKGASAIRYGGEAIAGVILTDPDPLPYKPGLGAELNYVFGSMNGQNDISLLLQGNHVKLKPFSWRVQGTFRASGNMRTPDYYQKNTGLREYNFSGTIGWKKEKYGFEIFGSYFRTKIGILSSSHTGSLGDLKAAINAPFPRETADFTYDIGRPYQQVQHMVSKANAYLNTKKGSILFQASYQLNTREEFDKHIPRNDSLANLNRPALWLWIQTFNGEILWDYKIKKWQSLVGAQFFSQTNTYKYSFLIPAYWNLNGGVFAIERWSNQKLEIELGARLDYRWMQAILFERGQKREPIYQYIVPTFSAGIDYHINEQMKWNFHSGLAWRAPTMNELFIGGLHHSTATVEIGNEKLKSEQSLNLSTGLNFDYKWIEADVSVYTHLIKNYIYLLPDTAPLLTIRGYFPVFRYTQTDVALNGSDVSIAVFPSRNIRLEAKASLLWGIDLKAKDWLAQLPSHRFNYSVRYNFNPINKIDGLFLGMNLVHVLRQTQLPDNNVDFLAAPGSYWLLNFDAGTSVNIKYQKFSIGFSIQNMLNKSYRDYMNRFRYFTDESGINVMLRLKVPLFFHK